MLLWLLVETKADDVDDDPPKMLVFSGDGLLVLMALVVVNADFVCVFENEKVLFGATVENGG